MPWVRHCSAYARLTAFGCTVLHERFLSIANLIILENLELVKMGFFCQDATSPANSRLLGRLDVEFALREQDRRADRTEQADH